MIDSGGLLFRKKHSHYSFKTVKHFSLGDVFCENTGFLGCFTILFEVPSTYMSIPLITLQGSSPLIFKSAKVPTMRRFLLLVIVPQRYVINVIEIPYILIYSHMKQPEYGTQFTGYLILFPILLGNLLQISEPE